MESPFTGTASPSEGRFFEEKSQGRVVLRGVFSLFFGNGFLGFDRIFLMFNGLLILVRWFVVCFLFFKGVDSGFQSFLTILVPVWGIVFTPRQSMNKANSDIE